MSKHSASEDGIGLLPLATLVIGSAIGGGIFGMIADLSHASAKATLIGWALVGTSMMMLSLSINNLNKKRPDINGGIYTYAMKGFGNFAGFISGWGYWITCWLGNVAFATLLMSAIGTFIPIFAGGQNTASIIGATVFLWLYAWLVNKGVEDASVLNAVVTITKLVPLFIFVFVSFLFFDFTIFKQNFTAQMIVDHTQLPLSSQVMSCIMVMLWVFVGIEGASVVGSRAKKKSDVGKATILGLLGIILVYLCVSVLPYGVLSREQLQAIHSQPALGQAFEMMVGPWGKILVNGGLIISLLGVWLSWTILPVETMRMMALDHLLPSSWAKVNQKKAPTKAIVITTICTNVFLGSLLFTDKAYHFAYTLGTAAIFITWLYLGLFQVKISWEEKEYGQLLIGILACLFQLWAIFFVALKEMFIVLMMYLPGIYFYYLARKEVGDKKVFIKKERLLMICLVVLAVSAFWLFFSGKITI